MEFNLKEGLNYECTIKVTKQLTANALLSGNMDVYATPAMIALMENVSKEAVKEYIKDPFTTVGIEINVKHIKASPIGATIRGKSILQKIDGKKLYYKVEAFDDEGKIGEGSHIRYIVNKKDFMKKIS